MKKCIFFTVILIFITSCASLKSNFTQEGSYFLKAEEAYTNSQYIKTVENCIVALEIDPDYNDVLYLLQKTYPLFLKEVEYEEVKLLNSSSKFKHKSLYDFFKSIAALYSDLKRLNASEYENEFTDKLNIYKEKATIDYYNAGVDDSLNVTINSDNKCFDYFLKAEEIWGEEYQDSFTIAASVLYRKAMLFIELGDRQNLINSISHLEEIKKWKGGYNDSEVLIDKVLNAATSQYVVIGDKELSVRLDEEIDKIMVNYDEMYIKSADNSQILRFKLNEEETILSAAKEIKIDTVVKVSINNFEHTPPQSEAKFVVESKRYWIDENDNPLNEVNPELVEYWHDNEDYRVELLNQGVVGYKDFTYSYIQNQKYSKLGADINIDIYSTSLDSKIGSYTYKEEYIDTKGWKSEKRGNPSIFNEIIEATNDDVDVMGLDQLKISLKKDLDLNEITNQSIKLIIEDNPMDKKRNMF